MADGIRKHGLFLVIDGEVSSGDVYSDAGSDEDHIKAADALLREDCGDKVAKVLDELRPDEGMVDEMFELTRGFEKEDKLGFVYALYRLGKINFVKVLKIALEDQYEGSVSKSRALFLKAVLNLAILKQEFRLVKDERLLDCYDKMSLDEVLQLIMDNLDSIHLRDDLLTALFARLYAADLDA